MLILLQKDRSLPSVSASSAPPKAVGRLTLPEIEAQVKKFRMKTMHDSELKASSYYIPNKKESKF